MRRAIALAAACAALITACGPNGDIATSSKPVEVTMTDNAYGPTTIKAIAGETITFVFRNEGSVKHEALFGDLDEQEAHHVEMAEMADAPATASTGDHGGGHGSSVDHGEMTEVHAVVVEPGQTVEVTHKMDGDIIIGCHIPGHWENGMRADVTSA